MPEPRPSDNPLEHIQPERSLDVAEVLRELAGPEVSREDRTALLLQLEKWLSEAKDTTELAAKERMLETAWVVIERLRMKTENRTEVLSPAQEKQMTELAEQFTDKQGAAVMLYGSPGTGKSIFLRMLAQRLLPQSNGVIEVTAMPMTTSVDLTARPALQDRVLPSTEHLTQLAELQKLSTAENTSERLQEFLSLYLQQKLVANQLTPEAIQRRTTELLTSMNLNVPESEPNHENFEYLAEVIKQNGGETRVLEILHQYFARVENYEKFLGLEHVIPGPFYEASTEGKILLLNEADKMALNDISRFGWGIEELLQSKEGDIVRTAQGLSMRIESGFLVLVSANDLTKIPDNIQRRFHLIHFQPGVEDLIWQARVLLTNDDGQSIFQDRPQDEHDLCRFMLWWEALGRHRQVAFNVNALNLLCDKLKQGHSFAKALDQVLQKSPELQPVFQLYVDQRGGSAVNQVADVFGVEEDTEGVSKLTLSELNWLANKKHFAAGPTNQNPVPSNFAGTPSTSRIQLNMDVTDSAPTLTLNISGENNADTGDTDIETMARHRVAGLSSAEAHATDWQITSSPLGQTSLVTSEGQIHAIDTPTGEKIEFKQFVDAKKANGYEQLGKIRAVIAARFISESQGVLVCEKEDGTQKVIAFHKELVQKTDSLVWIPQLQVDQEMTILPPETMSPSQPEVVITDDALLCTWREGEKISQAAYLIHPDSTTQRFQRIKLSARSTCTLQPSHLGSVLSLEVSGTTKRQWLRT
jgi:DNA polymerase III delta prime subunit